MIKLKKEVRARSRDKCGSCNTEDVCRNNGQSIEHELSSKGGVGGREEEEAR